MKVTGAMLLSVFLFVAWIIPVNAQRATKRQGDWKISRDKKEHSFYAENRKTQDMLIVSIADDRELWILFNSSEQAVVWNWVVTEKTVTLSDKSGQKLVLESDEKQIRWQWIPVPPPARHILSGLEKLTERYPVVSKHPALPKFLNFLREQAGEEEPPSAVSLLSGAQI